MPLDQVVRGQARIALVTRARQRLAGARMLALRQQVLTFGQPALARSQIVCHAGIFGDNGAFAAEDRAAP